MESYRLYTVVPLLLKFLNNFTNWYVRLNRRRIKGETGPVDCKLGLDSMFDTLLNLTILLAPYTPFLTENFYQNLKEGLPDGSPLKQDSVHFVMIPQFNPEMIN